MLASEKEEIEIVRTMLLNGADASLCDKNNNNKTSLHIAAEKDNLELFKMLIDCGADIKALTTVFNYIFDG